MSDQTWSIPVSFLRQLTSACGEICKSILQNFSISVFMLSGDQSVFYIFVVICKKDSAQWQSPVTHTHSYTLCISKLSAPECAGALNRKVPAISPLHTHTHTVSCLMFCYCVSIDFHRCRSDRINTATFRVYNHINCLHVPLCAHARVDAYVCNVSTAPVFLP